MPTYSLSTLAHFAPLTIPWCPLPPVREQPEEVDTLKVEDIEVMQYVGGLVKSFERRAA